ncbi:hypothetical protein K435DRAFT_969019 [Dendrothele bispora CBS 962.96]|uniref:Ricin B lectin domain-containing protein n=1 Tax=Dendrothele bispora (strain CBS 962.96) TaxID=1314807 RepID=A0A4S8LKS4_DENBC|nr:hypothetical protein K435DRAFT_969019 [Dendrothele bispora CBS 962.96]
MVALLNLTAAALAATTFSILDHNQNLALDLVNSGCTDYTSVQQFGRGPVTAQEWNFNLAGPGLNQFQVTNVGCGTTLTYAGSATGANNIRSPIVNIAGSGTTWFVTPTDANNPNGALRFIESASGLALTAWAVDSVENTAPLTLEPNRIQDVRQNFFLAQPL